MDSKTQYVVVSVLPNLSYRFDANPIRIPASNFVHIDRLILTFIWRGEKPREPTQ